MSAEPRKKNTFFLRQRHKLGRIFMLGDFGLIIFHWTEPVDGLSCRRFYSLYSIKSIHWKCPFKLGNNEMSREAVYCNIMSKLGLYGFTYEASLVFWQAQYVIISPALDRWSMWPYHCGYYTVWGLASYVILDEARPDKIVFPQDVSMAAYWYIYTPSDERLGRCNGSSASIIMTISVKLKSLS